MAVLVVQTILGIPYLEITQTRSITVLQNASNLKNTLKVSDHNHGKIPFSIKLIDEYSTDVLINNTHLTFSEFEEGRYSFEFSDNITIDQFLYSRIIFNARGLHTYSNVLKNDTDGAYIQDLDRQESFVNVGHKFQECINYYSSNVTIKNIGKYPMEKYIKCIVLNGKSTTCKWKWLAQENKFKIFVNRSSFIQTKICEYRKFGIEDGSIFAIMRCSMRIQYFNGDNKFDLPFISKSSLIQVSQFFVPEEMAKDIGIVLTLVALSLFLLLVLVWTYRRRITDILNEMKKIARYVVNQRQI